MTDPHTCSDLSRQVKRILCSSLRYYYFSFPARVVFSNKLTLFCKLGYEVSLLCARVRYSLDSRLSLSHWNNKDYIKLKRSNLHTGVSLSTDLTIVLKLNQSIGRSRIQEFGVQCRPSVFLNHDNLAHQTPSDSINTLNPPPQATACFRHASLQAEDTVTLVSLHHKTTYAQTTVLQL